MLGFGWIILPIQEQVQAHEAKPYFILKAFHNLGLDYEFSSMYFVKQSIKAVLDQTGLTRVVKGGVFSTIYF